MSRVSDVGHAEVNPTAGSILGFLASFGPMTGWDIDRAIATSIGNFWNVTRSQVYRELKDLADRGLVGAGPPGPRERTAYEIAGGGRAALQAWLAQDPGPDILRHRLLLTVFFSELMDADRFAEIISDQKERHHQALHEYRRLEADIDTESAMGATLRFGIAYEEVLLGWLDSLTPRGKRRTSRPVPPKPPKPGPPVRSPSR